MGIFNKKKKNLENNKLEEVLDEELKNIGIPINEKDRLKCIYYKEFQKKEFDLYKNNPVEFWGEASKYAESRSREYIYRKKEK